MNPTARPPRPRLSIVVPAYNEERNLPTLLLQLAAFTGDGRYRDAAEAALARLTSLLLAAPTGFAQWLIALDFATSSVDEVALVSGEAAARGAGDDTEGDGVEAGIDDLAALLDVAFDGFRPHQVVAVARPGERPTVPLLEGRGPLEGRATAYVCRGFACRQPVTEAAALAQQLARS
jgi:uncharacterized protein YyaL (SSP411 family)